MYIFYNISFLLHIIGVRSETHKIKIQRKATLDYTGVQLDKPTPSVGGGVSPKPQDFRQ